MNLGEPSESDGGRIWWIRTGACGEASESSESDRGESAQVLVVILVNPVNLVNLVNPTEVKFVNLHRYLWWIQWAWWNVQRFMGIYPVGFISGRSLFWKILYQKSHFKWKLQRNLYPVISGFWEFRKFCWFACLFSTRICEKTSKMAEIWLYTVSMFTSKTV